MYLITGYQDFGHTIIRTGLRVEGIAPEVSRIKRWMIDVFALKKPKFEVKHHDLTYWMNLKQTEAPHPDQKIVSVTV